MGFFSFSQIFTFVYCMFYIAQECESESITFNKSVTGVTFSAYIRQVRHAAPPNLPDWENYSLKEVETMLRVISTKFSMVSTFGVGARDGFQSFNLTNYEYALSQKYAAEADANINKEAKANNISMLVGIWVTSYSPIMKNEVELAFKTAIKANKIYPNAVSGFVLSENNLDVSLSNANVALEEIKKIKNKATQIGLKIGTRQNCNGILHSSQDKTNELHQIRQQILSQSDFVICILQHGQNDTFEDLLKYKDDFKSFNPKLEVMGQAAMLSTAQTLEEKKTLKRFWKQADLFAKTHNIRIYMNEAIDNPWNEHSANSGWFRLESNEGIQNVSSYFEKVSGSELLETALPDMSNVFLSILIVSIIIQIVVMYVRYTSPPKILTDEETEEFEVGLDIKAADVESIDSDEIEQAENVIVSAAYVNSLELSLNDIEIDWNSKLGSGVFGCVHTATLWKSVNTEVSVALKHIPKNTVSAEICKSFLKEIKILSYLGAHPNLVSIVGAYTAERQYGIVYIATELCKLGCLEKYLKDYKPKATVCPPPEGYVSVFDQMPSQTDLSNPNEECEISFQEMIQWSYDIACGMEYLASRKVIHADLATRNVLLTSNKVAKVTDFGLSRHLAPNGDYVFISTEERFPFKWMPIEVLEKQKFARNSDNWSFGVTIWEIFSIGDEPYTGIKTTYELLNLLKIGCRLEKPKYATSEIYNLMGDCWHDNHHNRPTFPEIKSKISELI